MFVTNLAILVLAGFVGYAVISKVPNTLHTPLMSGTNAIHGIVVLGGILVLGLSEHLAPFNKILLVVAIIFGTINVVGGFLVTDRMLEMFKSKPAAAEGRRGAEVIAPPLASLPAGPGLHQHPLHRQLQPVHLRAVGADGAAHRRPRQPHRRRRHGDRAARDVPDRRRWATGA